MSSRGRYCATLPWQREFAGGSLYRNSESPCVEGQSRTMTPSC
jgi:hypothetical protein